MVGGFLAGRWYVSRVQRVLKLGRSPLVLGLFSTQLLPHLAAGVNDKCVKRTGWMGFEI